MTIVASETPVTLLGGAKCDTADIANVLRLAPRLVAADGGGGAALAAGHLPEAVIGDLDSLSAEAAARLADRLHRIAEQDSTDFDKALRSIAAPLVLAVGFTGGRFDHELAVMSTLVARPDRPCIVIGAETIVFHCPSAVSIDLPSGALVSLYPILPVQVDAAGLRWPLDRLALAPAGRIGTSNAALGGAVSIRPSGPGLLVILARDALEAAVAGLLARR